MTNRANHPLYKRWRFIKDVTGNPRDPNYQSYGGAHGIENHFKDFDEFRKYIERKLGLPIAPYTQLHRKNQQDHYRPGNLVWATNKQVGRNQRDNLYFTYKRKTQCLAAWAEQYGIPYGRAVERVKYGWTIEQVIEIKPSPRDLARMAKKRGAK